MSDIYINKSELVYNNYKTPKGDKNRQCPFSQWKEYYIADMQPNLSEEIIHEPMENPLTGEMEFVKMNLLGILSFGESSEMMGDNIRTAITKASLTGQPIAGPLRELVRQEIELGNQTVISAVFKGVPTEKADGADTWWAEEGITEKKVDKSF